jgi:hypothetical protein
MARTRLGLTGQVRIPYGWLGPFDLLARKSVASAIAMTKVTFRHTYGISLGYFLKAVDRDGAADGCGRNAGRIVCHHHRAVRIDPAVKLGGLGKNRNRQYDDQPSQCV